VNPHRFPDTRILFDGVFTGGYGGHMPPPGGHLQQYFDNFINENEKNSIQFNF